MQHKAGYYYSTEAVAKNLLTELVEKGKMPIEEFQHEIPDPIFDEILKYMLDKKLIHIFLQISLDLTV